MAAPRAAVVALAVVARCSCDQNVEAVEAIGSSGLTPVLQAATTWLMGGRGQACEMACRQRNLYCTEEAWPSSQGAQEAIAKAAAYVCEDYQSGGSDYDPSATDKNCGWQGYIPSFRLGASRCAAKPPSFSLRFCPCRTEQDAKDPFNCDTDYETWKVDWSEGKKDWCCRHKSRGCTAEARPPSPESSDEPFDCETGHDNWQQNWHADHQMWCCQKHHRGCQYKVFGASSALGARQMCEDGGGKLPMPETAIEEQALTAAVASAVTSGQLSSRDGEEVEALWLGGSFSSVARQWQWDDGSEVRASSVESHGLKKDAMQQGYEAIQPWLALHLDGTWFASKPDATLAVMCRVVDAT